MVEHGPAKGQGLAPHHAACHHAGDLPAHADHAAGARRNAGGAAHRLHQVRTRPGSVQSRHPLRPCAQEHAGARDDHHRPAAGWSDCLRHHHRDRVPVARHGPAVHPGRDLCRHSGDGRLPVPDRLDLCGDQSGGGPCAGALAWAAPVLPAAGAARAFGAPDMQSLRYKAGGRAFAHIAQYHPELTALRRDLHAHPELGFEEIYTSTRVKEALKLCGVDEIHDGIGRTGVVGVIRGRSTSSGSMVGLRADMDALPLAEHNDFSWKSCKPGLMHCCGHDGHTAMLVGAARYLAETRNFDGTAVLVFQPGEEGFAGARVMMEDGLFDRFPVQSIYAMHNWPAMKPGTVGINSGPMMAAADRFTIEITGRGGHGAHAYQTVDVLVVAAHIITA